MSSSATLEATMRLEISQLQSSLAKSDAAVAKFKANLKKEGSGFGGALFGNLQKEFGSLLPAMGVAAVVGGFKSIIGSMDDLVDTALRLNESTEMIQRVEHASKLLASVDADGLVTSFLKLEKALGDLDNEAATNALADLGITADKLAAAPLDEKILMMSEAFQKARATGTGYNDILDLLGKSAGDLIPMFMQTRETIVGMFDDAHIVPDEEVQRLAALNDQIDGYVANLERWGTHIVGSTVGWLAEVGDAWHSFYVMSAAAIGIMVDTGSLDKVHAHIQGMLELRQEAIDQEAKDKLNSGGAAKAPKGGERAATSADKAAQKEADKMARMEEAQNKRIGDKYIQNEKLKRDLVEERLPIEGKIAALQERLAAAKELEAKAAVFDDVELQLDAEKERITIQREISRLMVEQSAAARDSAEECERIAKAARDEAAEVAKATAERRKQVAQHQSDRENTLMDLEVLRLRANGNNKAADKVERENRIEQEKKRLMKEQGASEEYALKLAKERARLEDKLEARRNGRGSHISGVTSKKYIRDAGGLDEFARNQKKRPLLPGEKPPPGYEAAKGEYFTGPLRPGEKPPPGWWQGDKMVPASPNGLSGRGRRPGRMMGGDEGSLSDRAARGAGAQDDREKQDTSTKDLLSQIAGILQQGLIG